jgi:hypothetical protein
MHLNIGAMRNKESQSDKFDDFGWCAWLDDKGKECLITFAMTTDPGKHWLLNPMNSKGTIITVPGQYIEVFGMGKHNSDYECFKQIAPIRYVRDNNKDTKLNFNLYRDPELLKVHGFWGICATNLHRASLWKILLNVGMYSAGCAVVQSAAIFAKLIALRDKSTLFGQKKWDYTLFEEL